MNNCAFIRNNDIEFRLTIEKFVGNENVAKVANRYLHLPDGIKYEQVEEITIYCGTINLVKIVYYKDGDQNNRADDNRISNMYKLEGNLSDINYFIVNNINIE